MPTPTRKIRRLGAMALLLFPLPFGLFGLGAIITALGDIGSEIGQLAGGVVFLAASLGMIGGAVALWRRSGEPASGELLPGSRNFLQHPNFPNLAVARSPSGGVTLPRAASRRMTAVGSMLFGALFAGVGFFLLFLCYTSSSTTDRLFTGIGGGVFSLVGLSVMGAGIHGILRVVLVGKTRVDLDREPVAPGDRIRVQLWQPGSFPITRAEIRLVGREVAKWTESSGSGRNRSSRTVVREHRFVDEVLAGGEQLSASASHPVLRGEATIPRDAMHSFTTFPCSIEWAVEVRLVIPRRPDVKELYTFRVTPTRPR